MAVWVLDFHGSRYLMYDDQGPANGFGQLKKQ